MDHRASDVQQDIEDTRAAITEKVELLEERVRETVEDAKTTVKQAVDLSYHVEQQPWKMVGLSILTGYLLRRLTASPTVPTLSANGHGPDQYPTDKTFPSPPQAPEHKSAGDPFAAYKDDLAMIKGVAVGVVAGVVRELIAQAMPAMTSYVKTALDKLPRPSAAAAVQQTSATKAPHSAPPANCIII